MGNLYNSTFTLVTRIWSEHLTVRRHRRFWAQRATQQGEHTVVCITNALVRLERTLHLPMNRLTT